MGTYVVVKRIVFIAGGIAHSVLGGMGAALYYGYNPLAGALIAAVIAALLIGWIRRRFHTQEDTLIGAMWAIGMAAGILFISQTPGYQTDLMSYLFGSILLVSKESLIFMALLDVLLLAIVGAYHRQFLAVVFDEEFSELRGLPVTFIYLLLLVLVAITVVLLIQVVGLIMVLALLTLPAAVAAHHVHSLGKMMLFATILGSLVSVTGLAISYQPDLPAGPTIVLVSGAMYLVSLVIKTVRQKQQNRSSIRQSRSSRSA